MRSKTFQADAAPPIDGYDMVLARAFTDRYIGNTDSWTREPAMGRPVQILLRHVGDGPLDVLDIGTGKARDVATILGAGHRTTGIDLHEPAEWQPLRDRWGRRVTLERAAFPAWNAGERRFDAILDNGCFHHQHPDQYVPYLAGVRDLLRPLGVFVVSVFTPHRRAQPKGYYTKIDGGRLNRYFTETELVDVLRQAGLRWEAGERIYRANSHRFHLVGIARPA
jgi:SAM-dependent methyltransferase